MSFGSRLKERREYLGLKQSELGKLLGITGSAIGNYEKGVSSPKADILYQVFDVLECDANYLFQDEMQEFKKSAFSAQETNLLKKYQRLNDAGKAKLEEQLDDMLSLEKYTIQPKPAESLDFSDFNTFSLPENFDQIR